MRERTKDTINVSRFLQKDHPTITQPDVISSPRLSLTHYFVRSHDRLSRKKPQQAELREATKAKTFVHSNLSEPSPCNTVMNVATISKGDPDIHIREKE